MPHLLAPGAVVAFQHRSSSVRTTWSKAEIRRSVGELHEASRLRIVADGNADRRAAGAGALSCGQDYWVSI